MHSSRGGQLAGSRFRTQDPHPRHDLHQEGPFTANALVVMRVLGLFPSHSQAYFPLPSAAPLCPLYPWCQAW